MKARMAALLAIALLSANLAACGGTSGEMNSLSKSSSSTPNTVSSVPPGSYLKNDGDKDSDDEKHKDKRPDDDDDRNLLAAYGPEAGQADRRAVTAVVKSYLAAAAAGDGTKACPLLYGSLASNLARDQSHSSQGGNTCATSLARPFREEHQQLVDDDIPTMVVSGVHVKGDFGLAQLGFRATPEREILLEREGHIWKMAALFDSELP
jgi:hypothetical protein